MGAQPLITVGMPVRNCESTVGAAIRSILWQTEARWNLIVIDDGSCDRTIEIARTFEDPRIRIVADGLRRGLAFRLNEAIRLSGTNFFARMDGDDIAYPYRFERQVRFLNQHPAVDLLGTGMMVFKNSGEGIGTRSVAVEHDDICKKPWSGIYLSHPTWMGPLKWFRKHAYSENAIRMEDQDLLLRTYRHSTFANLPDILLGYREDSFSIWKALTGRFNSAKSHTTRTLCFEDPALNLLGALNHTLKAGVELLAATTGLNYRVLRHRAKPVHPRALEEWNGHWARLTAAALETEKERGESLQLVPR
jgi:glycosyltransferase involved in cell wall biosynthesis